MELAGPATFQAAMGTFAWPVTARGTASEVSGQGHLPQIHFKLI